MGLRKGSGNAALRELRAALRTMPLNLARDVTLRAAPALTTITRSEFASGRTAYGEPRPEGVDGGPLTLVRTGAVAAQMRFVASDKVIKCELGPSYSKYLIGKYRILPNGALPASFVRKLSDVVAESKGGFK